MMFYNNPRLWLRMAECCISVSSAAARARTY